MAESIKEVSYLNEFFNVSKLFIDTSMNEIINAVGKSEDTELIKSHANALQAQFDKLTVFTKKSYEETDIISKNNVDDFMEFQAVTNLADNAKKTIIKNAQKGIFGDGFFSWLESNFEEIKKIVLMILDILFPKLSAWASKLFQIIDQILKLILGLFAGNLGKNRSKVMEELSSMEVDFWNELRSHKRFANYNYDSSESDD